MRVNSYRCDRKRCREEKSAEYLASTTDDPDGPHPPHEWLSVKRRRFGTTVHFCSIDCLAIWARQERRG